MEIESNRRVYLEFKQHVKGKVVPETGNPFMFTVYACLMKKERVFSGSNDKGAAGVRTLYP